MHFPYSLIAFDLDGTLSKSKEPIEKEMAVLLSWLSRLTKVAVISGGSFFQLEKQFLSPLNEVKGEGLVMDNILLLPVEGSQRFGYDKADGVWKLIEKVSFDEEIKKKVIEVLNEIISSGQYDIPPSPEGQYIEDRGTEVAFSALGQDAHLERKEKWDPDRQKRMKIKAVLESKVGDITVTVAGTISLDILPKGVNKGRSLTLLMKKLGLDKDKMLFVGDAIVPGGNDYSALEAGFRVAKVDGPKDTGDLIKRWVRPPVAFFCSEYALSDDPSMYAGGLGVLAGDFVLEAAERDMPFVAIGLKYSNTPPKEFSYLKRHGLDVVVDIPIGKDTVKAKVWRKILSEQTEIFLLDSNIAENSPENKNITEHLYSSDFYTRIKQQMILGIGGIKLLSFLEVFPSIYHLNEGHTAFTGLALVLERKGDLDKVVASKHTILSEAGLLINYSDFKNLFGPYAEEWGTKVKNLFEIGKHDRDPKSFSTTGFLLNIAKRKNGVSLLHTVFEKKKHPASELVPITNGVNRKRWQAAPFFNHSLPAGGDFQGIKKKLRAELFEEIKRISGKSFNSDVCTLVWARRFAAYKRPLLLFSDLKRLSDIISNQDVPLQVVISGKAHEADAEGMQMVEKIISFSNNPTVKNRVVYVPHYSLSVAEKLVGGADIWLNTPEFGKEACGTSGMKAGLNGALQCSVQDGWVGEVNWEGRGWALPDEGQEKTANVLYDLLENEILPCFYDTEEDKTQSSSPGASVSWENRALSTMELIEKSYTTKRMMDQYIKELYLDISL